MVREPGESVPRVQATRQDGDRITVDLADPTVLFFYRRDGAPACTTQVTEFDALLDEYHEAGVGVYGVSTDDVESHRAFAAAEDLTLPLLADPDANVADAFGVPVEDGDARRTTFVCARHQVCGVYEGVPPEGHARQVLADVVDVGLVAPPSEQQESA